MASHVDCLTVDGEEQLEQDESPRLSRLQPPLRRLDWSASCKTSDLLRRVVSCTVDGVH
jgi:hypothetical protein